MNNIVNFMNLVKNIPAPLIIQITYDNSGETVAFIYYTQNDYIRIATNQNFYMIRDTINSTLLQFDIKISDLKINLTQLTDQLFKINKTELEFLRNYLLAKDINDRCYQMPLFDSTNADDRVSHYCPLFFKGENVPWRVFELEPRKEEG